MKFSEMKKTENYFEVVIVLFFVALFVYMLLDFFFVLLFASSLVFLFYRPYKFFLRIFRSKDLTAFFMTILLILLVVVPFYFLSGVLIDESRGLVSTGVDLYENVGSYDCASSVACQRVTEVLRFLNFGVDQLLAKVSSLISSSLGGIFSSLWNFALDLCVFLLAFYFLLRDGDSLLVYLKRIVPMKNSYKEALFLKFRDVSAAVFVDSLFIAMFQGLLVGIGLYFTGFSAPIFWGVIAAFLALLPFVGAAFVWALAGLYLVGVQEYILGIGLLLYGLVIVSTSDNVLRPILLKSKVQVHSFIIFLSILGGISVFGFFGIFLGPLIVSLLITVVQLYDLEFY